MKNVEIFSGDRAQKYNDFIADWMPGYHFFMSQVGKMLPALLAPQSASGVLMAGCGTGTEMQFLREAGYAGPITGVDPSPEMIQIARKALANDPNITWLIGQVSDLNPEELFQGATLLLVLHFIPDDGTKLELLRSISQRLMPEAPFVLVEISGTTTEVRAQLELMTQTFPPEWPRDQIEKRIERILTEIPFVPEKQTLELLQEAGFKRPIRFFQSSMYKGWMCKR